MMHRLLVFAAPIATVQGQSFVDTAAHGWRGLGEADFAHVNRAENTWTWNDGEVHCTGQPLDVLRTTKEYRNFELALEWMHEKPVGNCLESEGSPIRFRNLHHCELP